MLSKAHSNVSGSRKTRLCTEYFPNLFRRCLFLSVSTSILLKSTLFLALFSPCIVSPDQFLSSVKAIPPPLFLPRLRWRLHEIYSNHFENDQTETSYVPTSEQPQSLPLPSFPLFLSSSFCKFYLALQQLLPPPRTEHFT